jgi:hypothetical protein
MQIERNFKKNPHTARFLMAFHTAGGTRPTGGAVAVADENQAEIDLAAQEIANYEHDLRFPNGDPEDLLDLVTDAPADLRSAAQIRFMDSLIADITRMDAELGAKTREWTDKATAAGHWTPGRTGNASEWIDKMIARRDLLKATVKAPGTAPAAEVADGRYAVEEGGTLKFFRVKNGRKAGFVFLDVQASDDWHAIRNVTRIREVLALIAVDAKAAMTRYGQELGECGHCGRTLTDAASRAAGIGPVCASR